MLNQFFGQLLPGMTKIADEHRRAGQQHDNLCGAYWAAIFLRSAGFNYTPEQIAQLAGTVLPVGDPLTCIPQGATPRQDYQLALPSTKQAEQAGTSVMGLMTAIAQLSQGAYGLIPIQTEWSADRVRAILTLCAQQPDWQVVPLGNIRTEHLWGAQLPMSTVIAYFHGEPIDPPPADWAVGHFLCLAGIVKGLVNDLIIVGDTYPSLGWQGYHLQSAATIAAALNRGDGNQGGILLFAAQADHAAIAQALPAQDFTIAPWDNGSPAPAPG